jgi:hypothetical protein
VREPVNNELKGTKKMIRYAILILSLLTLLLGCAQDVPLSRRDFEFARKDLELEREKYRTFAGSKEREEVDRQIKDHYIDHKKFYLIDEIDLGSISQEKRYPTVPKDEQGRIKEFNKLFEKKLLETQQPVQTE